jgi:hypothetical protein
VHPNRAAAFFVAWATSGVAVLCPALAAAETKPPEVECPDADPGRRRHDGFFARSDTGLAFLWAHVSGSGGPLGRTGILGFGQSASLSLGGTPERGLVIGGTAWTARIDPVFVEGGQTVTPDDDSVKVTLLRVGPFVDWYPDPTGGFHAQLSAAFTAQVESDVKGNAIKPAALGAALSVGIGHEWFVLDEISLGVLGRMAIGRVVREPSDGEQHTLWIIPELALTATYH